MITKDNIAKTIYIILLIIFTIFIYKINKDLNELKSEIKLEETYIFPDTTIEFFNKTPKDGILEAIEYYEIQYPEIVYAQSIHETGNFRSKLCIRNNNLFGLYNSRTKQYYKFNHWTESVEMYKNKIQNRLKKDEDYYVFLNRICYASDSNYISTIKRIVINESKNSKSKGTRNTSSNKK